MTDTIECKSCGGSGKVDSSCPTPDGPCGYEVSCPDCIRGRQPTPEVRERMVDAMVERDEVADWKPPYFGMDELALAAWLAEHKEKT